MKRSCFLSSPLSAPCVWSQTCYTPPPSPAVPTYSLSSLVFITSPQPLTRWTRIYKIKRSAGCSVLSCNVLFIMHALMNFRPWALFGITHPLNLKITTATSSAVHISYTPQIYFPSSQPQSQALLIAGLKLPQSSTPPKTTSTLRIFP